MASELCRGLEESGMADHLDALGLMPPGGDPSIDITDIFAFRSGTAGKSILILNVNPLTLAAAFNAAALYELKVDTNGDARPDIAFRFKFSPVVGGSQSATVRRATGGPAKGGDNTGDVIIAGAPVSFGSSPTITTSGDFKFFAGRRSDPFFFDLAWFLAGLPSRQPPLMPPFTPPVTDFFVGANVFGIALEVPNSALATSSPVGLWARTLLPEEGEDDLRQIDRMGRPAINTVFNKGKDKGRFNRSKPHTDRQRFGDNVVHFLESFGYDPATANAIMNILLPDLLPYDPSSDPNFPFNGRMLTDDVIDSELGIVTNGARTTDRVGVHTDLLPEFPFMGTPHP